MELPRLRQAVLASREIGPVASMLREELGLGEPYRDPAVEYFGLENAVFAIGDTFLEVVSPVRDDAPAARLLDRRGGDCGYMAMFQVTDLAAARARAAAASVREVFEVELDDIAEVHLHPGDIGAAIVSLSVPDPPGSWRWGGAGWAERSVPGAVAGIEVAEQADGEVARRWAEVIGGAPGVRWSDDGSGIIAIELELESGPARISADGEIAVTR